MAQQTINIGASPNDGTGTPLRTAFQYTNSNFSELYTAVGPSGNNIVVPGNATITGDLTVDTSTLKVDSTNNRVGVGTASPAVALDVVGAATVTGALTGQSSASFYTGTALPLHIRNSGTSFTQIGDNGTIGAGTAFIVGSSDASLRFQCGGAEQMRLNSTGLGVGVVPSTRLTVGGQTVRIAYGTSNTNELYPTYSFYNTSNSVELASIVSGTGSASNNGVLTFNTASGGTNAERMRLDSSGNVGIGVTPSAWLTGVKALDIGSSGLAAYSGGITHNAYFDNTDGRWEYKGTGAATFYNPQNGVHQWFVAASGIANNPITTFANAAMTLNASGNLLVARTGAGLDNTSGVTIAQSSIGMQTEGNATQIAMNRTTSDGTIVDIRRNNSTVGTIAVTTAGTTYNSISDYRLKEAVQPLAGGLARVNALKPSIYKWKSNGSSGEGFIAHELAEVVPAAVTGAKDAVNEDGTVNPQGVDLSKVVPILVAAIKELTAEVNALKNA